MKRFVCGWLLGLALVCAGVESELGFPRPPVAARTLYVVSRADADALATLQSLQGLLARTGSPEQLYFTNGRDGAARALETLELQYGVEVVRGEKADALLARFADAAKGYVVYDPDDADFNAKAMTAAVLGCAMVARDRVEKYKRGTSWREFSGVAPQLNSPQAAAALNDGLVIEQRAQLRERLRDYAVMTKAPVFFGKANQPEWGKPDAARGDKPAFGWGDMANDGGESGVITRYSELGYYVVPSDHLSNLSVLSGYDLPPETRQKPPAAQPVENTRTRLVTFVLTDGDNAAWASGGMATGAKWFGSPARARIPMGFGLPPAFAELNAPMALWYYAQANDGADNRDAFVAGPSGLGYFYPSRFPPALLSTHTAKLARAMAKLDLKYAQIIDFHALDKTDVWREYLKHPQIEGLIYIEYAPYHGGRGRIVWVEGKPVISARASMWEGLKEGDDDSVRKIIADMKRDLRDPDAYALVCVHAWSRSLEDVEALIKTLPDDVTVVAPDVFFATAKKYLKPRR